MATTKLPADKQQALDAAFDRTYPDVRSLLDDGSRRFALENMGQGLHDHVPCWPSAIRRPESLVSRAYEAFYQSSDSDEVAGCIDGERRSFAKQLRKHADALQKTGLPLTLRNLEASWSTRGPFARK